MTVGSPVSLSGVGLHTGAASTVRLFPAAGSTGIRFRLSSGVEIPARADRVVDTSRCTVLGDPASGERIGTVEHLLSACVGLGVDDLLVEVTAGELPIGDGSARPWADLLSEGGVGGSLERPRRRICLDREVIVTGTDGAFIAAYPAESLTITVAISFPHPLVGTQVARFSPTSTGAYREEIAGARTFGFIEEVDALRAAGLARGGTLDNAIVIYPDRFSTPLRFENELARHKLLDLMGDLALGGSTNLPNADIIAVKPSHRLNVQLAGQLRDLHAGQSNED